MNMKIIYSLLILSMIVFAGCSNEISESGDITQVEEIENLEKPSEEVIEMVKDKVSNEEDFNPMEDGIENMPEDIPFPIDEVDSPFGETSGGPPQIATDACLGKSQGDSCSVGPMSGECVENEERELSCFPSFLN